MAQMVLFGSLREVGLTFVLFCHKVVISTVQCSIEIFIEEVIVISADLLSEKNNHPYVYMFINENSIHSIILYGRLKSGQC